MYYDSPYVRGYTRTNQLVCLQHIEDSALHKELEGYLGPGTCSFCGSEGDENVVECNQFMEEVMNALRVEYERASDEGVPREDGDWVVNTVPSQELVEEICWWAVDADLQAVALEHIVPEDWVYKDYEWPRPEASLRQGWEEFCQHIKHHSRFAFLSVEPERTPEFGQYSPKEMLDQISEIARQLDMIQIMPVGTTVWRSRVAGTPVKCTASSMGAAPAEHAAPNRMSPAGISMFYGSEDAATAQNEVLSHRRTDAPPGHLSTCGFRFAQATAVLDLTRIREVPSVFDARERRLRPFITFMRDFAKDLSKAIPADGREHIDYAPTQVLTEYLRYLSPLYVEGIRFRSAQDGGVNYVLFTGPEGCTDPGVRNKNAVLILEPETFSQRQVP
ncbi:HEPN-associated N-terminal domain-containing protein [Streptomyces sp. NPDC056227]|uniref:HEPN-associated N-terminal domain-containing protein n=1 Tax=Streptomyces sp. NPDC056227 TaxID=3345753 RepID=UPI0035E19B98